MKSSGSTSPQISKIPYFKYTIPVYSILFLMLLDAFLAPFLESRLIAESKYFYGALKIVCHQMPTRCFWVFGSNMALCTRCFGIFLALFLTGLFMGIKRIDNMYWKTALVLIFPTVLDGFTQYIGLRSSNNLIRFVTGFLAGIGAGFFLFPFYFWFISGLIHIFKNKKRPEKKTG